MALDGWHGSRPDVAQGECRPGANPCLLALEGLKQGGDGWGPDRRQGLDQLPGMVDVDGVPLHGDHRATLAS